ncbi:unnamed protein product, partial [Choristocarpus tenellus]
GGRGKGAEGGGGKGPRSRKESLTQGRVECLWWATRDGSHVAIVGGYDGQVHFVDLEHMNVWTMAPPGPSTPRGAVASLTIATLARSNAETIPQQSPPPPQTPPHTLPRHLVVVLDQGAVFIILLERGVATVDKGSDGAAGGDGVVVNGGGGPDEGRKGMVETEYVRLRADCSGDLDFAPAWLDVGRGGGGSGGEFGVRVVSQAPGGDGGGGEGLHISVVSRAWGNKCTVKVLRLEARTAAAVVAAGAVSAG